MRVIIILEKYGGFCNRLFQSLHYHAYSIENNIYFFNASLIGLLKYENKYFYYFDKVNNYFLKFISRLITKITKKNQICFFINKKNYIKIVKGWDFRVNKLTIKHQTKLKKIYSFEKKSLKKKSLLIINNLNKIKENGKFLVGIHIRRGDYKLWNNGKFYFSNEFYNNIIMKIREGLVKDNKDPYFIVVSDEKISKEVFYDYFCNESWKIDQLVLQNCNLIAGPPSTFTMWSSYIAKVPLIQLTLDEEFDLKKSHVCLG